ncbi:TrlF family AAA-like ATPase [Klebsiella sp. BIGb0407]|uniref:TrlF family AAA-like ATPase n=1 Tax=Klebsiella sp. BIGb0407 TaxID=2940603 RepID=UPI00216A75EF|nr:DNA repair protein [Klebsiella sp. BIGb0407]MCS3434026.1 putative ATPase [Klebsiella sp. BIGb0407]
MIGSEWNKWDLHIHSPMTWLANVYKGKCDTESYVRMLAEQQLSLIGLTNYFYFQENELEIIREEIARQGLNITVLGNVEFRLDQQNKDEAFINVHVLFSERLGTSKINEILSRLPLKLTDDSGKKVYACESSVHGSGHNVETIVVNLNELLGHLSSSLRPFVDYIVAVCPNGYGGYRPGATGRSAAIATEIDRQGHMIFGGPRDREYFLTTTRYSGATAKPVFHCSDAHREDQIGRAFTWVKAKPTFEGLRQALLEPEGRLQLDADWPTRRIPKVHFSNIDVEGTIFDGQAIRFKKLSIPLNPDMVAIIGGRGTGKSLLLDALRSRFVGAATHGSEERAVNIERLVIELDKANGEKVLFDTRTESYDYLHVSQGEIKTLCQQPDLLSDEIKKMLRLTESEVTGELYKRLDENLNAFRSFREHYIALDDRQYRINTREYQAEVIRVSQGKINTLTSEKNKALIERFKANSLRTTELTQAINAGKTLLQEAEAAETSLNIRLTEMNAVPIGVAPVPPLDLSELKTQVITYIGALQMQLTQTGKDNLQITTEFREQGIEQDITGVLEKIHGYQREIQQAQLRDGEIQQRIAQYANDVRQRGNLSETYVHQLLEQKTKIDTCFATLSEKSHIKPEQQALIKEILTDIRIYGQPYFDNVLFYKGILERLNRGRFRTAGEQSGVEKLVQILGVRNIDDFIALIRGDAIIELPEESGKKISLETFLWKSEYFNNQGPYALQRFLYSPEYINSYLSVRAEFEYKGKTVEKLSAGQRGTFYVCLKLATDAFGSPFVFDQPEDDLDNDFIMRQLVPLFRKIKLYRQVIIVTHNANLVVNCDAEQVIVASNEDEVISYRSGALEHGEHGLDNSMRKAICDVLEGGQHAFETREQKYGIL